MVVYGESLANGMPLGALAGPRALIELARPRRIWPPMSPAWPPHEAVLTRVRARKPVIAALRIGGAQIQSQLAHYRAATRRGG